MEFVPGYFEDFVRNYGWTETEKMTIILADYLVIAEYGFLIGLALRNIWIVLFKQKEYRNLPIFAFYCFSLIAVALRLIYVVGHWTVNPIIDNIDFVQ